MFNIFKRPVNKESLQSWCKILDDIAKVAILAAPVVLYGENAIGYKVLNCLFLVISAYACLFSADFMRKNLEKLITEKEE
ncbi:hypothetical protein ACLSY3_01410 [Avibacterium avium]|uniref:Uncharacterized protein n=1 Tax=Avibacterium volantium TaxID=762 RepID=A0A3S4HSF5_AVIVO|nr:hypothetical protein [Avibacterium volantium]VEB22816.1 Uncharacterised protein [Avibacterium volantium]